ncbi:hypothetical protein RRG08_048019 [Elysia crispata]|uniref:Uncharacterized protein n=1 Tax=Elysia crispata TaxID=231223 RepID=A0AAE0XRW1_9GAST|nr:hypothetical protein RRG08_048019 [Elysia crispata]
MYAGRLSEPAYTIETGVNIVTAGEEIHILSSPGCLDWLCVPSPQRQPSDPSRLPVKWRRRSPTSGRSS